MDNRYQKTLTDFESFLQTHQPAISSDDFHPHFAKAFWEMLLNGGKRFRPNLLLALVDGLSPMMTPNAFYPALALECLHTYSLIHDDLPCMDDASLRRAHPTLHVTYGETSAVLAGDALNTYAFYLLAESRLDDSVKVALVRELASAGGVGGMIIGQALDCHFEDQVLSIDKLEIIHANKTAKLIAASLKMGALIAGASSEFITELESFGLRLGLFFQIRDDVIDAVQEEGEAGKPTRNDAHKNSYVNLLGLTKAQDLLARESAALQGTLARFPESVAKNLEWLLASFFKEIK
ncbi:geranyl transferase [Helicobacter sp. CLO-3]|uniref:polyprenyl synthetase family protein n=1 Tax=unclassified Helicobacter TaxID=2593540 RepID=UPI000804BA48|nr:MULTISPECIES: polyprenyl synthetase family protein [unclassified Helicobacter]OBV30168.1 geranyl transferase [Helicobacter sp. CLO-3]OHU85579.1 geranyl transferase [Helicobacter sp. CLO-3]